MSIGHTGDEPAGRRKESAGRKENKKKGCLEMVKTRITRYDENDEAIWPQAEIEIDLSGAVKIEVRHDGSVDNEFETLTKIDGNWKSTETSGLKGLSIEMIIRDYVEGIREMTVTYEDGRTETYK